MRFPLHVFSLPNGETLKLAQKTGGGVLGGTIWPSAKTMCHYLENHLTKPPNKTIKAIELGSGTGVVGLFAAGLGMEVTLTEHRPLMAAAISSVTYNVDGSLDYGLLETDDNTKEVPRSTVLLDLLDTNVKQNQDLFPIGPQVQELDWTKEDQLQDFEEHNFDLILDSDVTYQTQLHDNLANTIGRLLKFPDQKCILAHQQRLFNLKGQDSQLTSFTDILVDRHICWILQRGKLGKHLG